MRSALLVCVTCLFLCSCWSPDTTEPLVDTLGTRYTLGCDENRCELTPEDDDGCGEPSLHGSRVLLACWGRPSFIDESCRPIACDSDSDCPDSAAWHAYECATDGWCLRTPSDADLYVVPSSTDTLAMCLSDVPRGASCTAEGPRIQCTP